jgi:hypothetical protein
VQAKLAEATLQAVQAKSHAASLTEELSLAVGALADLEKECARLRTAVESRPTQAAATASAPAQPADGGIKLPLHSSGSPDSGTSSSANTSPVASTASDSPDVLSLRQDFHRLTSELDFALRDRDDALRHLQDLVADVAVLQAQLAEVDTIKQAHVRQTLE